MLRFFGLTDATTKGLRDLNYARRVITESYILQCDEIFVVSNIGRCITDEGVEHVIRLAQQAQLSNVGIVCTKADVCRSQHIEFISRYVYRMSRKRGHVLLGRQLTFTLSISTPPRQNVIGRVKEA